MNFDPNDRLRLAALDTRDALRKLSARITAAGTDPQLQAEALEVAVRISRTYGDLYGWPCRILAACRRSRWLQAGRNGGPFSTIPGMNTILEKMRDLAPIPVALIAGYLWAAKVYSRNIVDIGDQIFELRLELSAAKAQAEKACK